MQGQRAWVERVAHTGGWGRRRVWVAWWEACAGILRGRLAQGGGGECKVAAQRREGGAAVVQ